MPLSALLFAALLPYFRCRHAPALPIRASAIITPRRHYASRRFADFFDD